MLKCDCVDYCVKKEPYERGNGGECQWPDPPQSEKPIIDAFGGLEQTAKTGCILFFLDQIDDPEDIELIKEYCNTRKAEIQTEA